MAEEINLRSLYNMLLAERKERLDFQRKVENALRMFAWYNDADSANPDKEILVPAIVTRCNEKTGVADLVIYSPVRGVGWHKDDVKVGLTIKQWRPILIPEKTAPVLEAVEEALADREEQQEVKPSGSGARRPAAVTRS